MVACGVVLLPGIDLESVGSGLKEDEGREAEAIAIDEDVVDFEVNLRVEDLVTGLTAEVVLRIVDEDVAVF